MLITDKTVIQVLEKIDKERKAANQAKWDRRKKTLKKIAIGLGVTAVVVLGAGAVLSLTRKNQNNKPTSTASPEVEPNSFTPDDVVVNDLCEQNEGPFDHRPPDWIHTQQETDSYDNPNGTSKFFGYDNDDGTTTWYNPDGSEDCTTPTPSEDSIEWRTDIENGDVVQCY